jgi:hypothetical protein
MANYDMSREEAACWLAELIADPGRMSAKMFQEGYEASLRQSGLPEAEICLLLRKRQQVYNNLLETSRDEVLEDETDDLEWGQLEFLITQTSFEPEDIHYKAAALHQVRQLDRCLAALEKPLH